MSGESFIERYDVNRVTKHDRIGLLYSQAFLHEPGEHLGKQFVRQAVAPVDAGVDLRLRGDDGYAVSSNSSRPISQRRISDVPAPIS